MKTLKQSLVVFTILLSAAFVNAQETIIPAGGTAQGNNGTLSYSVGQVVYIQSEGDNGTISQGVQQPFEISTIVGIKEFDYIQLNCIAFPNPVTETLILSIDEIKTLKLTYRVVDLNGKIVFDEKINSINTKIDMTELNSNSYILEVSNSKQILKTLKILKNKK